MGNKFKLGRGNGAPGIQKRIANMYKDYAGKLPAHFGFNQDALTAKITCEGSIEVSLRLMEEAVRDGNVELETALMESLKAVQDRLNQMDFMAEVATNG